MSVLGSTLCEDESESLVRAILIGTAVCLFAPAVYFLLGSFRQAVVTKAWLLFSPAYGPALISQSFTTSSGRFVGERAATLGWATWLGGGCLIMGRTWKDQPYLLAQEGWRSRVSLWLPWPAGMARETAPWWLDPNHFFGWQCRIGARRRRLDDGRGAGDLSCGVQSADVA